MSFKYIMVTLGQNEMKSGVIIDTAFGEAVLKMCTKEKMCPQSVVTFTAFEVIAGV